MKDNKTPKIGDKIIKCSRVYRIFKIEKRKFLEKQETVILYKPFYKKENNNDLILSIPLSNFDRANIRTPISKKELKLLFQELSKNIKFDNKIDILDAKETLNLNNPYKCAEILKCLWLEKNDNSESFTKSREEIFKLAINQLAEEVAFVSGLSVDKAKLKIQKLLEKIN